MKNIYQQQICGNCLTLLETGESDHNKEELKQYNDTLMEWSKEEYIPIGMTDSQSDPYFSHSRCDICDCLAGNRYDYNFIDKS